MEWMAWGPRPFRGMARLLHLEASPGLPCQCFSPQPPMQPRNEDKRVLTGTARPPCQVHSRLPTCPHPVISRRRLCGPPPVQVSCHTSYPPGHLCGRSLLSPIFQVGKLRQRTVESIAQRLPQDNNSADLAPSNATPSTILPPSLLHGRVVLSPSPQASSGCSSTQSAFVETHTKVRHTASHSPPHSFPKNTQRRDAANPLCSWGHCSPVRGPEPDGQQGAGRGREQWALWPGLRRLSAPTRPLPPEARTGPGGEGACREGRGHGGCPPPPAAPLPFLSSPHGPRRPPHAFNKQTAHLLCAAPPPAPPRPQGRGKDAPISGSRCSKRERANAKEGGQRQGPMGACTAVPLAGGLERQKPVPSVWRGRRSRSFRRLWGGSSLPLLAPGVPRLAAASPSPRHHPHVALCVHVSPSSCRDSGRGTQGHATPGRPPRYLTASAEAFFPNKATLTGSVDVNLGGPFSPG